MSCDPKCFDPKCRELAEDFLLGDASEEDKNDLAQTIQDAVEGWFDAREERIIEGEVSVAPSVVPSLKDEGDV